MRGGSTEDSDKHPRGGKVMLHQSMTASVAVATRSIFVPLLAALSLGLVFASDSWRAGATAVASLIPAVSARARVSESYGKVPLAFEANHGQTDEQVRFLARGSGYGLFLTPTHPVLSLRAPTVAAVTEGEAEETAASGPAVLRMSLV